MTNTKRSTDTTDTNDSNDAGAERRRGWRIAAGLVLAIGLLAALLTACGDSGASTSSGDLAAGANVEEAQTIVDGYLADPEFVAPPAFDASPAAGKTVWWLGHKEGVGEQWANFTQEALESADVKFNFYDIGADISDAKIQQGFELAIAGKADAIILTGGPSAYAYEAQINAAGKQGIPVVTLVNSTPDDQPEIDGLFVDVTYDYASIGKLLAAWVVADSKGNANVLSIDLEGVPSSQVELGGFEEELKRLAPNAKWVSKPITYTANVASEGANLVRTSLLADPGINYVVPPFDSMALWAQPGVEAAGKEDDVRLAGFNAIVAQMQNLKKGGPFKADVGASNEWLAYAVADNVLRALVGKEAVADPKIGYRLFTHENVQDLNVDEEDGEDWYGIDFPAEYEKVWSGQ